MRTSTPGAAGRKQQTDTDKARMSKPDHLGGIIHTYPIAPPAGAHRGEMEITMATDKDILDYAQNLPDIYREILATFPRVEPSRRAGYGLALQTIAADFEGRKLSYGLAEVIQACERLQQHGLIDIKHRIFVQPTKDGERVIAALTRQQAPPVLVPDLPPPPR